LLQLRFDIFDQRLVAKHNTNNMNSSLLDSPQPKQYLPDKEVIKSIIGGKEEDFEILVNRYYRQILVYLCRLLNFNQGDAEDVLQQTFANAYSNIVTYNPTLSFSSWLYRIAHNLAVDLIRKKSKFYIIDTNDQIVQNQIHSNDTIIQISQDHAESKITKERLESVLKNLDINNRNLLTMFYLQGLSINEISDILKVTANSVGVKLTRARDKARSIIAKLRL
jgi:RNA polymerase sigma-70 factor, ECF subfamily